MGVIAQTQFTPLPEVLCLVIAQLNSRGPGVGATSGAAAPGSPGGGAGGFASLEAILRELALRYHGVQQPSEQLVYQALGSLCSEGNIYHTGENKNMARTEIILVPA